MRRAARVGGLSPQAAVVLCLLPVAAALVSLCIGRMGLPLGEVLRGIGAALGLDVTLGDQTEQILWTIRMPRILLALLVGAGLSVSGCAFQSLFANPLATPDTLGVASGASFGAALALLMGWHLLGNPFGIQPLWPALAVTVLMLLITTLTAKEKVSEDYLRYKKIMDTYKQLPERKD